MIIGTAGHIDHGKSSLIKALTGIETDRLPEEKKRGISIALGYAFHTLSNGQRLGFIDVPGHEKLVHTMVAGACGMDAVLLVVAADDGLMPQTLEHLNIIRFLDIRSLMVVITKIDLVSLAQVRQVHQDIQGLLESTQYQGAPFFYINTKDASDQGLSSLLSHLNALDIQTRSFSDKPCFRMPIDRVFTLPGLGTVVTGTVIAGEVSDQQVLTVAPLDIDVRIKGLHAQNEPSASARMGDRCALNLSGIEKTELQRGQVLIERGGASVSQRFDLEIHLVSDQIELSTWMPVHIHTGSAHTTGHLVPLHTLDSKRYLVQIVCADELVICAGDRLIIRNAQANETIAGGVVLDPQGPTRRRGSDLRIRYLLAVRDYLKNHDLGPLLALSSSGLDSVEWQSQFGSMFPIEALPPDHVCVPLAKHASVFFCAKRWESLITSVLNTLTQYHELHPDEPGVETMRLKRMCAPLLNKRVWLHALDAMKTSGQLNLNGAWWYLSSHTLTLTELEEQRSKALLELVKQGGFNPDWIRDIAETLGTSYPEAQSLALKLVRMGLLEQVVKDLFYDTGHIHQLIGLFKERQQGNEYVDVIAFKDACGLGRKRTIQLLEYFDRVGYTRRTRRGRYLVASMSQE